MVNRIIETVTPSEETPRQRYIARCTDPTCFRATHPESIPSLADAKAIANYHVRETGHTVNIEQVTVEPTTGLPREAFLGGNLCG